MSWQILEATSSDLLQLHPSWMRKQFVSGLHSYICFCACKFWTCYVLTNSAFWAHRVTDSWVFSKQSCQKFKDLKHWFSALCTEISLHSLNVWISSPRRWNPQIHLSLILRPIILKALKCCPVGMENGWMDGCFSRKFNLRLSNIWTTVIKNIPVWVCVSGCVWVEKMWWFCIYLKPLTSPCWVSLQLE